MTVKKYNKLVRDKIPEIIESQGKQCKVYVAVNEDYQQRLKDKLQEEVKEFLEDPCVEELADIEEILLSIAEINKWDLTGARIAKNITRGGFWRRYVLQEVRE
jgi:predicted house-cleaning noncanonical NTP pyrophosphatase (MazG superfamily)|tara:strand:+ start:215 stop:523 length:309 start_codon:yes stop_codon:yes gene_type:complete